MNRILSAILVLGLPLASAPRCWAVEPNPEQAKAIAGIRELGGKVTVDEKSPGQPVVRVDFSGTKVTDAGLLLLRQLSTLDDLCLKGTQVTDAGLEHLRGLRQLQELDLRDTKITDDGLARLNGLLHLKYLFLCGTQVTDAGLKSLQGLLQLAWLDLGNTKLTDVGLERLKEFTKLEVLYLGGTRITDAGLEHLGKLIQLQELYLDNTRVTDAGLRQLKRFKRLECLSLAHTRITDAGLKHLAGVDTLAHLFLQNTKVTADSVEDLQLALPICQIDWKSPTTAEKPDAAPPAEEQSAIVKETDPAAERRALIKILVTDKDPMKRRNAALTLAVEQWDIPSDVFECLAAAIRNDKDEIVRAAAVDALMFRIGAAHMPWSVLIDALGDGSARVRVRAAIAIDEKLGGHENEEASDWIRQPLLVKAAQGSDPVVRGLVALAVGKKTNDLKAALPVLLAALRQDDASPMPAALGDKSDFETATLSYLGVIGPDAKGAVPLLLDRFAKMESPGEGDDRADHDAGRVAATVSTLVHIGPTAVPELVTQIKTRHGTARTVAAMALAELGKERQLAIPVLIRSLHDACGGRCVFSHTRRFDVVVLARCGHEAVPALLKVRKSQAIGMLAFEALTLMGDDADAVLPQLIEALNHQDDLIRHTAVGVLGTFGEKAERAVPALLRATKDSDDSVAQCASGSLASIYMVRVHSDDDLKLLAGLDKLESLYLNDKNISGRGLVHLSGLRNLHTLWLPPSLTDVGLEHLKGLTNLKELFLARTQVTDAGLRQLKGLTNLETLYLDGTQISDAGLRYLSGMVKLERLSLRATSQITDVGLAHLRTLTKLRSLNLWASRVTDAGLIHLAQLKNLDDLTLSDHITDAGLPKLAGLTRLLHLSLAKSKVTKEGVHKLEVALPKCQIWFDDRDVLKGP